MSPRGPCAHASNEIRGGARSGASSVRPIFQISRLPMGDEVRIEHKGRAFGTALITWGIFPQQNCCCAAQN